MAHTGISLSHTNIIISLLIKILPCRLFFAWKTKLNYFEYLSIQNAANLLLAT